MPNAHLWTRMPLASRAAPLDVFGVVLGLGFVLSFGYWCTDFVMMQRAFTARTELAGRQVPLLAGFGKILFSFVVLPGLGASMLIPELGRSMRFDQALPAMMTRFYSPMMLSLGLTALLASLMSGLAANISGFAAVWTEDIYRSHLVNGRSDRHYLLVGRAAAVIAASISLLESYIDFFFTNLMEHVQLIFSVFGAPFWAIFLLGMATKRTTERGAVCGFLAGSALAMLHLVAISLKWIHYGSAMNANFHIAIYAFCAAALTAVLVSRRSEGRLPAGYATGEAGRRIPLVGHGTAMLWVLSGALLVVCFILNWVWR